MASPIYQLHSLSKNHNYSIDKIEWWLMANSDLYSSLHNSCTCFTQKGKPFCTCIKPEDDVLFEYLYQELDKLTQIHKLENQLKKELYFLNTTTNFSEIKNWLIRNEKVGSKDLACFFIDYLDYSEKEIFHLLVFRDEKRNIEVFVDRNDFKSIIKFKELFDELYYIQKIYPEGLRKIDHEISKSK